VYRVIKRIDELIYKDDHKVARLYREVSRSSFLFTSHCVGVAFH